jgi:putative drug exporter of the RND superfamily
LSGSRVFAGLATVVESRARWVVGAWVLLAIGLTVLAPSLAKVGVQDDTDFLPSDAPSQQADTLIHRLFPNDPKRDAAIIVVSRAGGLNAGDHVWFDGWARALTGRVGIGRVQAVAGDPGLAQLLRSEDGAVELAIVDLKVAPFTTAGHDIVSALRSSLGTAPPGVEHHVTGLAGLAVDQADAVQQSFERTALVTILLVLAILVFVYRSALAPFIPLASIGIAFLVSRGVVGVLAGHGLRVASLAETFMVLIVFGAGTDYCLFLVSRYREDLAAHESTGATVRRTSRVIGPVLAASAATVIVGFLAQLSARFGLFRTMGPALAIAVAIALLAGLTLTPALLSLAGKHVFWPSPLERVRERPNAASPRWHRVAEVVRSRPTEVLLAGTILLLLPAAGLGWLHQSFDLVRDLPPAADARAGFQVLEKHLPGGRLSPIYVVLDGTTPILTDDKTAAIDHLTDTLRRMPGVAEVRSLTQPSGAPITTRTEQQLGGADGGAALGLDPNKVDLTPLYNAMAKPGGLRFDATTLAKYPPLRDRIGAFFLGQGGTSTRLLVSLAGNPYDPSARKVFHDIDDVTADALAGGPLAGAHLAVGGPASFYVDIQDIAASDTRVMGVVLFGGIFIVLAILLQSLVAPFYLLATVLASFAATLGLTVIVFEGIFGQAGISFFVTPLLFIILVALGADYNIFVTSRIREELAAGKEPAEAAAAGLVQTGRVITSAGMILAGTFAALLVAPLPMLRQMGFAVGVGILIDTFIVRSMLVPAATVLLGKWAFWPGYQRQRNEAIAPAHLRLAGAGVALFAAALLAIGLTTAHASPITRIAKQASATPPPRNTNEAATNGTDTSTSVANTSAAPARTAPSTPHGSAAGELSPTTLAPKPSGTATASRIAAPHEGSWRYHAEGTRRVGLAGSTQPFTEDVTTTISRIGGTDQAPEIRVLTNSGGGTEEDHRRYTTNAIELLSTRRASAGMEFGGTLEPPQQILRYPAQTGQSWQLDWKTESVSGHSTFRVTAVRQVTVAGKSYPCTEVTTDSTFSGQASGTQHQIACWIISLGMTATTDDTFQGNFNNVPFEIHERRQLSNIV